jgi:hypothetical protein
MFLALADHGQRIVLTPRGAIQAYRCGLHSGFRKCCIRYWVSTWAGSTGPRQLAHIYAWLKHESDGDFVHGYIPCPECIAERRPAVKVIPCPQHGKGSRCYGYTDIHWTIVFESPLSPCEVADPPASATPCAAGACPVG